MIHLWVSQPLSPVAVKQHSRALKPTRCLPAPQKHKLTAKCLMQQAPLCSGEIFTQHPQGPHVGILCSMRLLSPATHTLSPVQPPGPSHHTCHHFCHRFGRKNTLLTGCNEKSRCGTDMCEEQEARVSSFSPKQPCAIKQAALIWSNEPSLLIFLTAQLSTEINSTLFSTIPFLPQEN